MQRRMKFRFGSALLFVGVIASACSQAESESSARSAEVDAPTREAFIAEVTPICDDLEAKLKHFEDPMSFPAIPEEFGAASDRYAEVTEQSVAKLVALAPPADMTTEWEEFTAALARSLDKAALTGQLVDAGNTDTDALWQAWTDNSTSRSRAMELASEMNLGTCEVLIAPMHMDM